MSDAESGANGTTAAESLRLRELLEPSVLAQRLFLEDVIIHTGGTNRTVHVVVDLPEEETGGVSLDAIAEVSRVLSEALDNDPHDDGQPYDLEVSSPGVGRPLTEVRHWRRAKGRMVRINLVEGEKLLGRIVSVADSNVTVIPEIEVKKGMKAKQGEATSIPFTNIRSGKVEVEFSHLNEDELIEEPNLASEEA
ncbi:ribosome maturation factor RimP [Pseudarthrobacter sp. J1738]|uniref:ribosome maturation factor RimP n=1 Tax=unclassified Pseudarthrobacter TaxID=2647000 RepID=UPI003D2C79D2